MTLEAFYFHFVTIGSISSTASSQSHLNFGSTSTTVAAIAFDRLAAKFEWNGID